MNEYRRMLGRLANGNEFKNGVIVHVVPNGQYKSLCGQQPGRRSVGWSEPHSLPLPTWAHFCPKCDKKAATTA